MPLATDAQTVADLLLRVYEIHERIIARTGGLEGLRDGAMLHAAVARPFASFAGEDLYPDDFDKAATLFHSLIKSHPFMDGTKRTAFAATLYFLEVCGYPRPTILPEDEVIRFCLDVAEEICARRGAKPFTPKRLPKLPPGFGGCFKRIVEHLFLISNFAIIPLRWPKQKPVISARSAAAFSLSGWAAAPTAANGIH